MFVRPKTFLVGYTCADEKALLEYLEYTNNQEFMNDYNKAKEAGLSTGEILCSFYAKLCYKSLTLEKNSNIDKIRDVKSNLEGVVNTGHGSVLEHCYLNFITTDCSRIYTHEAVRHRVGCSYSQTSGRYVRLDDMKLIQRPELEGCEDILEEYMNYVKNIVKRLEERTGLSGPDKLPFDKKKKITSAIRSVAPNGIANELGWGVNIRSLRHIVELRTSRHADWEIRYIFNQVADIVNEKFPHMLYGAEIEEVDGLKEYRNLKV